MITRAQAEALLTLAESLEACERLNITIEQNYADAYLDISGAPQDIDQVNSMSIRLAVNAMIPKQEAVKKGCTKPGCFPYCDCGGIDDAPQRGA